MKEDDKMRDSYDFDEAQRGPVSTKKGVKLPVSIRLDGHVVEYFKNKAGEQGKYQALINQALNDYIQQEDGLEKALLKAFQSSESVFVESLLKELSKKQLIK